MRLISYLLYGLFSAEKKKTKRFPISVCARERSFEVMFTVQTEQTLAVRSKPKGTVETVSLKMGEVLPLLRQDLGQI